MKKQENQTFFLLPYFLVILFLLIVMPSFPQSVGISSQNNAPNPNAGLDINYSNKGFLIPRISLVASNNPAPLANHVRGMLLYNTVTSGDLIPGLYCNNGTKWVLIFPKSTTQGGMQYWDGSSWKTIASAQAGRRLKIDQSGTPVWAP